VGASIILPVLLALRGLTPQPPSTGSVTENIAQQANPPSSDGTATTKPADGADATKPQTQNPAADTEAPPDKRVLGVLPNYRTANATDQYTPISTKQKLIIACKDSFDYPLVLLGGGLAGISQLSDSDPSYGQGVKGYAKRLGAYYGDEALGNMFTEGFMPALLHEDPRYFRVGPQRGGSFGHRTWYAFSRIFVTHTDAGGTRFNYSEWVGNAIGVAISNTYHPDTVDWRDNAYKLLEQCATDGVSQILKEFWPDMKPYVRKFFHMKPAAPPASD